MKSSGRLLPPIALLATLALAACSLPGATRSGTLGPNGSITGGGLVSVNSGGAVSNNGGTLVSNNAAGLVSNNSGGLTGVVLGPAAGLVSNNAAGLVAGNLSGLVSNNSGGLVSNNSGGLVSNNSGGLVSNNSSGLVSNNAGGLVSSRAGGFWLLATTSSALTTPIANASVSVVDEHDQPVTGASVTTDASGAYVIQSVGPSRATIFIKARFEREGQTLTLLAATAAPREAVQLNVGVDPATSLVAKKTAEAAVAGKLDPDNLDAQTLTGLAAAVRPLMTGKAMVAAGMSTEHLGAYAFDAMVAQSPSLNAAVAVTASKQGLGALVPTGPVSVIAGGSAQGYLDAVGPAAQFAQPYGIVAGDAGSLYVSERGNHRIRMIAADGTVTTLAGSGKSGFADGTGATAQFNEPRGLARDAAGNLYVADGGNHRIRKITPAGVVTTLAGGGQAGFADGQATTALFNSPRGLAIDAALNVYVADTQNFRIRKIDAAGNVTTLAGGAVPGYADGPRAASRFAGPLAVALNAAGELFVADYAGHRLRKVAPDGSVSTLAGDGTAGSQDGSKALLKYPAGLAVDSAGALYIAEFGNNDVRRLGPDGVMSTIDAGSSPAFNGPYGVAVAADGTLYVADTSNHRVCKLAH